MTSIVEPGPASPPIVFELDGTLIKTDLLFEMANEFLTRQPFRAFELFAWLTQGRSRLKVHLAEATAIDALAASSTAAEGC